MAWPIAIAEGWHPVARASEVSAARPRRARLMDQPLVLFRSGDQIVVFRDRCPHRGVPLSYGKVEDGTLACPYHGWRFGPDGRCIEVPGSSVCANVSAVRLPTHEAAGLIWTSLSATPRAFPVLPPSMTDDSLDRFWWKLEPSEAGLLDALENHLDPAHPHHLHPWLVRPPNRRQRVQVEVRSGPWGAEAIYVEHRRNDGLLSRAMEGERARSIGRLWPPTIGEVRLEAAGGAALSIVVVFAPEGDSWTRPWAHFASDRRILPAWFKRWALKAFHWPVLQQDRRMLRLQQLARTDEPYRTGPLDVLSSAIWRHADGLECREASRTTEMFL